MTTTPLEVARLVLNAAPGLSIGEVVALRSDRLSFEIRLYLRHKDSSNLILYTDIEGDPEEKRRARIRRALADKCPKLAEWTRNGGTSVLALESNDIQLSNAAVIGEAVQETLRERTDQPDIIVLVETNTAPMFGWVLKEWEGYGTTFRNSTETTTTRKVTSYTDGANVCYLNRIGHFESGLTLDAWPCRFNWLTASSHL